MIINQKNEHAPVIYGESTVKKATINPDEIAKLQYLLTKGLYSDPIGATIVEWTNNAVDSVVMSGKDPIKNPVIVELGATNMLKNYFFRVTDKGLGLNKDEFETICMSYLSSTKTGSNDTIGAFGIGMKSFLSLERPAMFTCRKDGYEWKFMVYQGEEFVEYDVMHEGFTSEENGVICEVALTGWSEKRVFEEKARYRLAYYDTVVLLIDNIVVNNTIYREKYFQWSTLIDKNRPMHLSLKDVYYEIDFTKLDIPTIYLPVCLRFELEEGLQPTPSRESLIYNEGTKTAIMKKLKEFSDWLIEKYNEGVEINSSILDVWDKIDDYKPTYIINEKSLELSKIDKYSDIPVKGIEVKDISLKPLKWYKKQLEHLVRDYEVIHEGNVYRRRRKYLSSLRTLIDDRKKVVLVTGKRAISGISGEYILNTLHRGSVGFVVREEQPRRLKPTRHDLYDKSYYTILQLGNYPKDQWRDIIKEFQIVSNQIASSFIDETKIEETPEFQVFYEQEKQRRKDLQISSPNYKVLNKQEGEVTIQVARKSKRADVGLVFDKKTEEIQSFYKRPVLFVLVEDSDEEMVKKCLGATSNITWFIKVGPREIKKLPKVHNIITMQEFTEKSKPFRRTMTAIRIEKSLNDFKSMGYSTNEVIKDYSARMKVLHEKLAKYFKDNNAYIDDDVYPSLLALAEEGNLWDAEIIDEIKQFEEMLKLFEFVSCIDHSKVGFHKVISQMLLFKKKYQGAFDDYELVKKEPVVVVSADISEDEEDFIEEYEPEIGDEF